MDLVKIGKIVFAVTLLLFGLGHLTSADAMAGMVPGWLPGGVFWVYLTGLGLIASGLAIIMNKWMRMASLLLALMLVIFILTIHLPGVMDGGMQSASFPTLLKDLAMTGGALIIAGHSKK